MNMLYGVYKNKNIIKAGKDHGTKEVREKVEEAED
jgi:hypothetical protein